MEGVSSVSDQNIFNTCTATCVTVLQRYNSSLSGSSRDKGRLSPSAKFSLEMESGSFPPLQSSGVSFSQTVFAGAFEIQSFNPFIFKLFIYLCLTFDSLFGCS